MKVILGLLALLLILISGYIFLQRNGSVHIPFISPIPTARVENTTFKLYIADDAEEQTKGLSNRDSMPQDYGMLFTFDRPGMNRFWMKDMKFPLDIIYLRDNRVVTVFENVKPPSPSDGTPALVQPEEEANMVLELNAGAAEKNKITKGDEITFTNL